MADASRGSGPSVLFLEPDSAGDESSPSVAASTLHDLNLDRVIEAIAAGRKEYDLEPFFHVHLESLDAVAYRQEVMRDVETRAVREPVDGFARGMKTVRQCLTRSTTLEYPLERARWRLAAVEAYVECTQRFAEELRGVAVGSRGLKSIQNHLETHVRSERFGRTAADARARASELALIRYRLLIRAGSVTVMPGPEGEEGDYSAEVERTFLKFRQAAAKDYRHDFKDLGSLNHVEAQVLDRVALLYPEPFGRLLTFCDELGDFIDPVLTRFDREIQFFVAVVDYAERFRNRGLAFCYPEMTQAHDGVAATAAFDVALADRLLRDKATVITNDFFLKAPERVLVVTGANQGGKTTFARSFAQLHFLASLGCPVPARHARLFLYDHLFTHFEREEDITALQGKLEEELVRVRDLFGRATANSLLVLNEIFSSTTLEDALFLGREVLARVMRLDLLCVCVTFLDELATLGDQTVSMVTAVDPEDPTRRTFRIERRPPDGLAYALAVAEKRRVTYRALRERLRSCDPS